MVANWVVMEATTVVMEATTVVIDLYTVKAVWVVRRVEVEAAMGPPAVVATGGREGATVSAVWGAMAAAIRWRIGPYPSSQYEMAYTLRVRGC